LAYFYPLAKTPGTQWYSLQVGEIASDMVTSLSSHGISHLGHRIQDFSDTAGILANLDLLIAVDTSIVHLAGAMNKPVWTLLPYAHDWRWMTRRTDTPWYPSMRLFRQEHLNQWDDVFQDVKQALDQLITIPSCRG